MNNPARILIVDDQADNRQLLELILEPEGFVLLTASNGAEALALAAREQPDVILLDAVMPGMNGYQVATQLSSDPATRDIPIVMITGLSGDDARALGVAAGAVGFLSKPVRRADVYAQVDAALLAKGERSHVG